MAAAKIGAIVRYNLKGGTFLPAIVVNVGSKGAASLHVFTDSLRRATPEGGPVPSSDFLEMVAAGVGPGCWQEL